MPMPVSAAAAACNGPHAMARARTALPWAIMGRALTHAGLMPAAGRRAESAESQSRDRGKYCSIIQFNLIQ